MTGVHGSKIPVLEVNNFIQSDYYKEYIVRKLRHIITFMQKNRENSGSFQMRLENIIDIHHHLRWVPKGQES